MMKSIIIVITESRRNNRDFQVALKYFSPPPLHQPVTTNLIKDLMAHRRDRPFDLKCALHEPDDASSKSYIH
jgi:hypothetical protein